MDREPEPSADRAAGTLTAVGRDALATLIAHVPIDTTPPSALCGDSDHFTLDIDFDDGGPHGYAIDSCDEGQLQNLTGYVSSVANAIIVGAANDDVVPSM